MSDNGLLMIDNEPIVVDSSVLTEHKEALDRVFQMYIEDINPFIIRFEVAKSEFPIEVQNEIRAIYGHLVRATMSKDHEVVARNVEKMYSHSKRALLDCFKYASIVFSDCYDDFMHRYEGIDLTYIDEGKFLPRVVRKCKSAREMLQQAKIAETSNITEVQLFELYQGAYNEFEQLNDGLDAAEQVASFLQHKATKKEMMGNVSLLVGIAGFMVGIIGCVIGILF